jgi:hypothetical protein
MSKWYMEMLLMSLSLFTQMGTQGYLLITIDKLSL